MGQRQRREAKGNCYPETTSVDNGSTKFICILYDFFFPLVYAVVKHLCQSSTSRKVPVKKLALSVFPKDIKM